MPQYACIRHGWPLPCCSPPPLFPLPRRSPPRTFLCIVPRLNSAHRSLATSRRRRRRSRCCCGDIATNTSRRSVLGDSGGPRAEGSGMVMGGSSLRRWFEEALGQRLNLAGTASFARVMATEEGRKLAIPHLWAPDIRWIDWRELERLGFRGIVFDKDNTITAPYSLSLWPPISASFAQCVSTFPGRVAVFSNSAGLYRYDPDGSKAKALEDAIGGIHVIMHEAKKPAGTTEDIEKYFGCSASHLIMVGDRCFTDVVYGNQNGFLTILTGPLTLSNEPFIVQQVRKLERYLVSCWCKKGLKPPNHSLHSACKQCIKSAPLGQSF